MFCHAVRCQHRGDFFYNSISSGTWSLLHSALIARVNKVMCCRITPSNVDCQTPKLQLIGSALLDIHSQLIFDSRFRYICIVYVYWHPLEYPVRALIIALDIRTKDYNALYYLIPTTIIPLDWQRSVRRTLHPNLSYSTLLETGRICLLIPSLILVTPALSGNPSLVPSTFPTRKLAGQWPR